jgi:hypothetical protein
MYRRICTYVCTYEGIVMPMPTMSSTSVYMYTACMCICMQTVHRRFLCVCMHVTHIYTHIECKRLLTVSNIVSNASRVVGRVLVKLLAISDTNDLAREIRTDCVWYTISQRKCMHPTKMYVCQASCHLRRLEPPSRTDTDRSAQLRAVQRLLIAS